MGRRGQHPITRWHECTRKVKHKTLEEAGLESERLALLSTDKIHAYKCRFCHKYHVGRVT